MNTFRNELYVEKAYKRENYISHEGLQKDELCTSLISWQGWVEVTMIKSQKGVGADSLLARFNTPLA